MQPQDQNYQSNDQADQPIISDDQAIKSEQLESAPSQEDSSSQPPMTPFVDGDQDDIPDVPMITTEPTLNNQPEMEHLPEPPTQSAGGDDFTDEPKPQLHEANLGINEQTNLQDQQPDNLSSETMSSDGPLEVPSQVEPMPYVGSDPTGPIEQTPPEDIATMENSQVIEEPQTNNPQFDAPPSIDMQVKADDPLISNEAPAETIPPPETPVLENASVENNTNEAPSSIDSQPTPPSTPEIETPTELSAEAQPPLTPQPPTERVSLTDNGSFTPQEPKAIANDTVASPEEKENIYTEICSEIIKEQEQIIGTLAVEQANYVEGLTVDPVSYHCTVTGDGSKVIDDLIEQYRDFFGHAAVEVCKEAASRFLARLPAEELPTSLR